MHAEVKKFRITVLKLKKIVHFPLLANKKSTNFESEFYRMP